MNPEKQLTVRDSWVQYEVVINHSAIVSQSGSKLHQSTCRSSRHSFSQVRNFIFVAHHTSNVQMGPMRSCDKLSQERSCCACTARTRRIIRETTVTIGKMKENHCQNTTALKTQLELFSVLQLIF